MKPEKLNFEYPFLFMKSLSQIIKESISKDLKDQATAYSVDHHAGKFYRKDLIDVLKYLHDYKELSNIAINAWDPKHPHTMAYKYDGLSDDGTMKFQYHHDDEFVNKDLYGRLMMDLENCDAEVITTEFDNGQITNSGSTGIGLYVQSATAMQDDFYSKDSISLIFEG